MRPKVVVDSDYEHKLVLDGDSGKLRLVGGYFERLVIRWIDEAEASGHQFKHEAVRVTAGPWRAYAVSFEREGSVLHLDFYSALRTGFGSLDPREIEEIKELL